MQHRFAERKRCCHVQQPATSGTSMGVFLGRRTLGFSEPEPIFKAGKTAPGSIFSIGSNRELRRERTHPGGPCLEPLGQRT
jgi:hypothetical protein